MSNPTLRESLRYEPHILRFGTSGRRGEVVHLTQLEIYINATAELEYLQSLSIAEGGIRKGDEFYYAYDLRPSSTRFVPEQGGRGEIAQAIERAIVDAGMRPVNLGQLPTPALTHFALRNGKGSMMITGSHIPFERNGYKTNSSRGELLKKDEAPINQRVEEVRRREYNRPADQSLFGGDGLFKAGHTQLSPEQPDGRLAYIRRYSEFFPPDGLSGVRLLVYQHSAVGRDMLVEILQQLGATVIPAGRSETFVPIDTEAIDADQLGTIQQLFTTHWREHGPIDAVVSTDGDSDRPLILGVEPSDRAEAAPRVRFFGGDLVGMIVAQYLGADAVVVPISCNDAIDRGELKQKLQPKTRIGSPYVIAGMEQARQAGAGIVCGWEANGGFLTGSDIQRAGKTLTALPTRDAILPIVATLLAARQANVSVVELFSKLPARFSKASLLRNFSRPLSMKMIDRLSPADPLVKNVVFSDPMVTADAEDRPLTASPEVINRMNDIRESLSHFFTRDLGFGLIRRLNYTDGVRIYFDNGDVAHVRPSGNADELRIYAVADTQDRAEAIALAGVAEPDGILRRLQRAVGE